MNTDKMWEILSGMTLSQKKEFFSKMTEENNKVTKIEDHRKTFLQQVTDWGYKSPTDFLIEGEFIPNPSVKKPRMVITDDVRRNIVTDLTLKVPTKEIARKYGVTTDAVYNIKTKNGLTKTRVRETTVLVKTEDNEDGSVILPDTPPSVNPTDGVQPSPSVTVSSPSVSVPTPPVTDSEKSPDPLAA